MVTWKPYAVAAAGAGGITRGHHTANTPAHDRRDRRELQLVHNRVHI